MGDIINLLCVIHILMLILCPQAPILCPLYLVLIQLHLSYCASNDRRNKCFLVFQVQNIVIQNQEFGLSEDEPASPFYYANFDGILGMAYPAIAVGGSYTAMQEMLRQGQLSEPIFSFYFSR